MLTYAVDFVDRVGQDGWGVSKMKERRRSRRYNIAVEVEYDVGDGFDIQFKTYTINVSEVGLLLPLNKAVKPGKKINMKLKLPDKDKEINTTGMVVWREPLDKSLAPEENAGVEFLDMDRDDRIALADYLKNNSA